MNQMTNIGIIGGGASGIMAAIVAARLGAKVTIIERQNRVGKKILVTGNGRCNITNTNLQPKHFHTHGNSNSFSVIEKFTLEDTLSFFKELGIEPLEEKGKLYPLSEQASSVLDVMRLELVKLGVEMVVDTCIVKLKKVEKKWVAIDEQGANYSFDKVIVATGGLAAPSLGCDTKGYDLLKKLGHSEVETYPTLVHITSSTPYCKMMQGTRVKGDLKIVVEGKVKREETGEVLFTEDGLSGPPIFQLSRVASLAKKEGKNCEIYLDVQPKLSEEAIVGKIYDRIAQNPNKTIEELFVGWMHKKVIMPVIKQSDIGSPAALCENLDYDMICLLAQSMKKLVFKVTGTRGYKFAQATAGGISIDEINLEHMASMKQEGIYVTGEVLDVDGDCGGYNLQWAWSTGYLAGKAAAE